MFYGAQDTIRSSLPVVLVRTRHAPGPARPSRHAACSAGAEGGGQQRALARGDGGSRTLAAVCSCVPRLQRRGPAGRPPGRGPVQGLTAGPAVRHTGCAAHPSPCARTHPTPSRVPPTARQYESTAGFGVTQDMIDTMRVPPGVVAFDVGAFFAGLGYTATRMGDDVLQMPPPRPPRAGGELRA